MEINQARSFVYPAGAHRSGNLQNTRTPPCRITRNKNRWTIFARSYFRCFRCIVIYSRTVGASGHDTIIILFSIVTLGVIRKVTEINSYYRDKCICTFVFQNFVNADRSTCAFDRSLCHMIHKRTVYLSCERIYKNKLKR